MDPPHSLIASFTGSIETRICGRDTCHQAYSKYTQAEKANWKLITNSRNTAGDSIQWFCGPCVEYYRNKHSTHIRGTESHLVLLQTFIDDSI